MAHSNTSYSDSCSPTLHLEKSFRFGPLQIVPVCTGDPYYVHLRCKCVFDYIEQRGRMFLVVRVQS